MAKANQTENVNGGNAKKKGGRKPAPEGETKGERFTRLARSRVTKALNAIRTIGNLSGSEYESTDEQRDKLFAALRNAVDECEQKLYKVKASRKTEFDF